MNAWPDVVRFCRLLPVSSSRPLPMVDYTLEQLADGFPRDRHIIAHERVPAGSVADQMLAALATHPRDRDRADVAARLGRLREGVVCESCGRVDWRDLPEWER
mgnify:CR=1 FL=1